MYKLDKDTFSKVPKSYLMFTGGINVEIRNWTFEYMVGLGHKVIRHHNPQEACLPEMED